MPFLCRAFELHLKWRSSRNLHINSSGGYFGRRARAITFFCAFMCEPLNKHKKTSLRFRCKIYVRIFRRCLPFPWTCKCSGVWRGMSSSLYFYYMIFGILETSTEKTEKPQTETLPFLSTTSERRWK